MSFRAPVVSLRARLRNGASRAGFLLLVLVTVSGCSLNPFGEDPSNSSESRSPVPGLGEDVGGNPQPAMSGAGAPGGSEPSGNSGAGPTSPSTSSTMVAAGTASADTSQPGSGVAPTSLPPSMETTAAMPTVDGPEPQDPSASADAAVIEPDAGDSGTGLQDGGP